MRMEERGRALWSNRPGQAWCNFRLLPTSESGLAIALQHHTILSGLPAVVTTVHLSEQYW